MSTHDNPDPRHLAHRQAHSQPTSVEGSNFLWRNLLSLGAICLAFFIGSANPFIGVVAGMVLLGAIWNIKLD